MIKHIYEITIDKTEMRRREDGTGFSRVKIGETAHRVEVQIDIDEIARRIGVRAAGNKTGRAAYLGGAVVVRRLK